MEEEPILILIYAWFDLSGSTDCFTRKLGWEQKRRLIYYTKMRLARAIACAASASRLMSPSPTWSVSPTWPAHLRIHTSAHHRRAWEFLHLPTSGKSTISFVFHTTAAYGTRHCNPTRRVHWCTACTPRHLQQPVVIHHHHIAKSGIYCSSKSFSIKDDCIPIGLGADPRIRIRFSFLAYSKKREREREQWLMARYWCCACSRIWPTTFS